MSGNWTADQVLALAPDAASAKNGKGLANAQRWHSLGRNQQAIWGLCQGSGDRYQVKVDIENTNFHCTCPSPKFPCKHTLGLMLLLADNSQSIAETDAPDWVVAWLTAQAEKAAKKAAKTAQGANKTVDKVAQAKRISEREKKIAGGLRELDLWITDLIRQGLSQAVGKNYQYWDSMAARLVDAQASGLARRVRELAGVASSGAGWQERLLEKLAQLYLLSTSYQNLLQTPSLLQNDIRSLIGWTQNQDELLTNQGIEDHWLVLGQIIEEDPLATTQIKIQRVWLFGKNSQRYALLLNFAVFMQPLERSYVLGEYFEGELVFYPSAYPLRAVIKKRSPFKIIDDYHFVSYFEDIDKMFNAFAQIIINYPWVARLPVVLKNVVPVYKKNSFILRDQFSNYLQCSKDYDYHWQLLAQSGGHPVTIFGEWNGETFLPIVVLK